LSVEVLYIRLVSLSTATRTAVSSSEPFTDTESARSGLEPTVIDSDDDSESPLTASVIVGSVVDSGEDDEVEDVVDVGVCVGVDVGVGVGVATAKSGVRSKPVVMRLISMSMRASDLF